MKKIFFLLSLCLALLAAAPPPKPVVLTEEHIKTAEQQPQYPPPITVPCVRVIDGDTIKIPYKNRIISLRLIGLDTPEYGEQGFEQARQFVIDHCLHKYLRVEFDHVLLDRYGRLLGYVFISPQELRTGQNDASIQTSPPIDQSGQTDEDFFLNAELLRAGLANFTSYHDTKRYDRTLWESYCARAPQTPQ